VAAAGRRTIGGGAGGGGGITATGAGGFSQAARDNSNAQGSTSLSSASLIQQISKWRWFHQANQSLRTAWNLPGLPAAAKGATAASHAAHCIDFRLRCFGVFSHSWPAALDRLVYDKRNAEAAP
jgi:uncharacterized membrane protein YfcA